MEHTIPGIHHVTAIAGAPQTNVDFYTGVLGLRLVKQTVNFDDPGTYHFYYGDRTGTPGSILTFFPFDNARAGRAGAGMASAVAFSVPTGALDFWMNRLADRALDFEAPHDRFGEPVLALHDPDSLRLELVAHAAGPSAEEPAGDVEGVPSSAAIRSFHSVTLTVTAPERTARLLTGTFGYQAAGEAGGRLRFRAPGGAPASIVDLQVPASSEGGRGGAGTVHHVAFRARDEDEQQAWREAVAALGFDVTPVRDRQYFRSIYFREPSGVLFEIATDAPGFFMDETEETLGTSLKLPSWLESHRERIENRLIPITLPTRTISN